MIDVDDGKGLLFFNGVIPIVWMLEVNSRKISRMNNANREQDTTPRNF